MQERYEEDRSATVDKFIARSQNALVTLAKRAEPHNIPEDYISFLEYYGGLSIENPGYNFSTLGIGPMVEEWYGYIMGDEALSEPGKYGFLSLGSLAFRGSHKYDHQSVEFFLDLAGIVQKHSVIGVGPWDGADPPILSVLNNIHAYSSMWKKLANSFSEWLEQAAETLGVFSYT